MVLIRSAFFSNIPDSIFEEIVQSKFEISNLPEGSLKQSKVVGSHQVEQRIVVDDLDAVHHRPELAHGEAKQ